MVGVVREHSWARAMRVRTLWTIELFEVGLSDEPGVYALVSTNAGPICDSRRERFWLAAGRAHAAVSRYVPEPPLGVDYIYDTPLLGDAVWRIEATDIGLAMLRHALARAGAPIRIVVQAWGERP